MSTSTTPTHAAPPPSPPRAQPQQRRACEQCNRKKAKCDKRKPVCGSCSRTGTLCQFPSRRKKPTRRPQPKQPSRELSDNLSKLAQILSVVSRPSGDREPRALTRDLPESLHRDFLNGLLSELQLSGSQDVGNLGLSLEPSSHPPLYQRPGDEDGERDARDVSHKDTGESISIVSAPAEHATISASQPSKSEITYAVAMELINLFFENIQPWLPLLHKPRFLTRIEEKLRVDGDVLSGLDPDEALTVCSMFALSARFSNHPRFADLPCLEKGAEFADLAAQAYGKSRLSPDPPFAHLQGCILLAFYLYTSGPSQQAWIVIGVCVRLAYIMGLSEVDDEEWVPLEPVRMVEKEELRRAWWLVWELDTFASITFRKPFSIDRRRMAVKLPMSDQAWFSNTEVDSAEMITSSSQTWRSLQGCANQDARAWFLLANHYMSCVFDQLQQRQELTLEDKLMLENEVASFRMALPPTICLEIEPLDFSALTFAKSNWVIGIHIMLMASSFMISAVTTNESAGRSPATGGPSLTLPLRQRAINLSRIISQWDARYIPLSHPLLSCFIVAPIAQDDDIFRTHPLVASSYNLSKTVLSKFAERWKIASIVQGHLDMVEGYAHLTEDKNKLAKEYAAFFHFTPFSPVNTPSNPHWHERNVPSVAEGMNYRRSSDRPTQSQEQRLPQLPENSAPSNPLPDHPNVANYQTTSFEFQDFLQSTYDGAVDSDSGILNLLGGYQDPAFMQSYLT